MSKKKIFSPKDWLNVPSNDNTPAAVNKQLPASFNSEDTQAKVERVITLIEQSHTDITAGYDNWLKLGFALSSELLEAGREYFHRISRQNAEYNPVSTDKQYDKCMASKGSGISIATLFQMAKDAGVDISNPNKTQSTPVGTMDFWTYGSENGNKKATPDSNQAPAKIQMSKNPNIQSDEIGSKWKLDEEDLPLCPVSLPLYMSSYHHSLRR